MAREFTGFKLSPGTRAILNGLLCAFNEAEAAQIIAETGELFTKWADTKMSIAQLLVVLCATDLIIRDLANQHSASGNVSDIGTVDSAMLNKLVVKGPSGVQ